MAAGVGVSGAGKPPKRKPRSGKPKPSGAGGSKTIIYAPPRAKRPPIDPISAAYDPILAYYRNEIARQQHSADITASRRQQMAAEYAKWVGGYLPQQIQGIYSNAAGQDSAWAKGFSHGMQLAQQQGADQANANLNVIGAPEGQQLHPNADAADVLYGVGGYMPATTLTQQGAGFAAAASFLPPALLAQGAADARKVYEESDANVSKLELELAKLESKKAEATLTYREKRRAEKIKLALESAKLKAAAKKDAEMMAYRWASLDLQQKKAILSDKRQAQRIFQAQKRIGIAERSQSFNEWYKQQTLGQAQTRIEQGQARINQAQTRLNQKNQEPLGTPRELAKWRANARSTVRHAVADGGSLAEIINALETDPDAGPIAIWGPVVAGNLGLTKNLPANLKKYPKSRVWQLATKLGWDHNGDPREWLLTQWRKLFPKDSAAPSGGRQNAAFIEGNAVLPATFTATHQTDGLPGYPATDYMLPAGTTVGAPTSGRIFRVHHTQPGNPKVYGWIMYLQADNGDIYFLTHFDNVFVRDGQRVRRGSALGTVAPYGSASHIHIGIHRNRRV